MVEESNEEMVPVWMGVVAQQEVGKEGDREGSEHKKTEREQREKKVVLVSDHVHDMMHIRFFVATNSRFIRLCIAVFAIRTHNSLPLPFMVSTTHMHWCRWSTLITKQICKLPCKRVRTPKKKRAQHHLFRVVGRWGGMLR